MDVDVDDLKYLRIILSRSEVQQYIKNYIFPEINNKQQQLKQFKMSKTSGAGDSVLDRDIEGTKNE